MWITTIVIGQEKVFPPSFRNFGPLSPLNTYYIYNIYAE
jgi:hypothetical protein